MGSKLLNYFQLMLFVISQNIFRDVFEHKGQYTSFTVFAKILLLLNRSIVSIIF